MGTEIKVTKTSKEVLAHLVDTTNPHSVTAAQVGAVDLTTAQTVAGDKTFTGDIFAANLTLPQISVVDNDAKLALTGLLAGQEVMVTGEGNRVERFNGDPDNLVAQSLNDFFGNPPLDLATSPDGNPNSADEVWLLNGGVYDKYYYVTIVGTEGWYEVGNTSAGIMGDTVFVPLDKEYVITYTAGGSVTFPAPAEVNWLAFADETEVVDLTTDQTIVGEKTFTDDTTINGDLTVGSGSWDGAIMAGDQTHTGAVTFSNSVKLSGLTEYADDTTAGVGGLVAGEIYTTSGAIKIKL
jgi:hypothetical protein